MDTVRYPLINKIILYIQLAFQLFAGQAIYTVIFREL